MQKKDKYFIFLREKNNKQANKPSNLEFCLLQNYPSEVKGEKYLLDKQNLNVFLVTFHNLGEMSQCIDRHNLKPHTRFTQEEDKIHTRRNTQSK